MNRPPAFQCYASDTLGTSSFQSLDAGERGLLFSLLCLCWTSDTFPDDPAKIARFAALDVADVRRHYTAAVKAHFEPVPGKPGLLRHARLADQFAKLAARREERVATGKRGADSRWRHGSATGSATGSANASAGPARRAEKKRTEESRNEASQREPIDPFVADIERAERESASADEYLRATRGH